MKNIHKIKPINVAYINPVLGCDDCVMEDVIGQMDALITLANRYKIRIDKVMVESELSLDQGMRPVFNDLMGLIYDRGVKCVLAVDLEQLVCVSEGYQEIDSLLGYGPFKRIVTVDGVYIQGKKNLLSVLLDKIVSRFRFELSSLRKIFTGVNP